MFKTLFGTPMRAVATTGTGISLFSYVENKLSPNNKVIVDNFNSQAEAYRTETQDLKYEKLVDQRTQETCNESLQDTLSKAKEYFKNSKNDTGSSTDYYYNKEIDKLQEATDIIRNCRKSKFTDNLFEIYNKFNDFIHSLNSEQLLALCNLLGCITIFLFLLSLITIYYSDFLIKYFQLEDKNTWLAKFVLIRRKFNNYYYGFNIIIILGLLFSLIFVNFLGLFFK